MEAGHEWKADQGLWEGLGVLNAHFGDGQTLAKQLKPSIKE